MHSRTFGTRRGEFEERYEDVLENIEFAIISVYREHPEMTNDHALSAVNALIRVYNAELKGRTPPPSKLEPLAQAVYAVMEKICEWRLGRQNPFSMDDGSPAPTPEPLTVEEILACLKRIRKSIKFWQRQLGRRGYLDFVNPFIP